MKRVIFSFYFFTGIISVLTLLTSCHSKKEEVITKRIQYDVNIKSPNPNYDWWIQNLPGPQRENLIKTIIKGALTGKYKTYDYFFQPISKTEVAHILSDTLKLRVRLPYPPYSMKDTLLIQRIGIKDIQRIRFLEEWRINPVTLQFSKTVIGIAPVARRTDAEGNIRWQPLFWIVPSKESNLIPTQTP